MHGIKVVTMELSRGREWLWYADLQILAIAPHLDDAGRDRCVDEFLAEGRSQLLRSSARDHLSVA